MPGQAQAHLDVLARQAGFPDYATYSAYQQKQALMRQSNSMNGQPGPIPGSGQPAPTNWLQHLLSSIPGSPAYLFSKIDNAFTKATGQ